VLKLYTSVWEQNIPSFTFEGKHLKIECPTGKVFDKSTLIFLDGNRLEGVGKVIITMDTEDPYVKVQIEHVECI
jgi:hypothetical protein